MDTTGTPVHPEFGELLTKRANAIRHRVGFLVLALVLGWPGLMFLLVAANWFGAPSGPTPVTPGTRVFGGIVGALLVWGSWGCVKAAFSASWFYEFGATRTVFGRTRQAVAYERVDAMWYDVTRHYLNGIYVGTDVKLELEPIAVAGRKAKKLTFSGKHKEKPDGVLSRTFIKKNFKGEDELDAVKTIIAMAIVERWMRQDEFSEAWTGSGVLTPRGFLYGVGTKKGTLVPYDRFGALGPFESGYRWINAEDKKDERIVLTKPGDRNFWPGWLLVNLMKERAPIDTAAAAAN